MQRAYIGKLMELAERDRRVLHLLADSGTGFDEMFRRNFPDQMFNFGISENHMVGAAAGLASAGKIPFVFTAGAFLAYRSYEFIRNDICFQNLHVVLVGQGSGLAWSSLGPTHHTTEDVAVLRALPNLMILSPATPNQVAACVEAAYLADGPVYLRIGMNDEPEFFEEGYQLLPGENDILRQGKDVCILSTGSILEETMAAAELLEENGIGTSIVSVPVLKPFPYGDILSEIAGKRLVVTVEEHNVNGGLGSMMADVFVKEGVSVPLLKIGLEDDFAVGYGTVQMVRKENGLCAEDIRRRIKETL